MRTPLRKQISLGTGWGEGWLLGGEATPWDSLLSLGEMDASSNHILEWEEMEFAAIAGYCLIIFCFWWMNLSFANHIDIGAIYKDRIKVNK